MKIRPSLKLYFLGMMIMTGVLTISIMSMVSVNSFLAGVDFSMSDAMRHQANRVLVSDGYPIRANNFVVASRWEDLPVEIKTNLNEQDLIEDELLKSIDGNPLFSRPEAGYFAMKVSRRGQVRYVSSMFQTDPHPEGPKGSKLSPFLYIFIMALVVMVLFSFAPYFILHRITLPVEKLMLWAKQLNKEQLSKPVPDFHYSELNSLANIVLLSLQSVQEGLRREERFLGYASHELRMPIAVTRTNSELLRQMISKDIALEKQLQVLDRIERASLTMADLTETLLWLNRQQDKSIPIVPVTIGSTTQQLLEELRYLINGKTVDVTIEVDDVTLPLPEVLCRIVITNLIRNALQHTNEGLITIKQSGASLIIINQNLANNEMKNELGFGLGLELTKRLVEHYGWQYKNIASSHGHHVEINFCSSNQ